MGPPRTSGRPRGAHSRQPGRHRDDGHRARTGGEPDREPGGEPDPEPGREPSGEPARARRRAPYGPGSSRSTSPATSSSPHATAGAVRAYVRDVVDSRRRLLGFFMPVFAMALITTVGPASELGRNLQLGSLAILAVMAVEAVYLARGDLPDGTCGVPGRRGEHRRHRLVHLHAGAPAAQHPAPRPPRLPRPPVTRRPPPVAPAPFAFWMQNAVFARAETA